MGLFCNNGMQVVNYIYDTWGKLISTTGSLASTLGVKNPYRYRGYRYDNETGLYYLHSRYYNCDWGRYINADETGGKVGTLLSHNVFAYYMNNPVNLEDPSGNWPKLGKIFKEVKKYIHPVAEIIGGLAIVVGGISSGNPLVATAAIIYGGNHIISGAMDFYYTSKNNKKKVGKNNIIQNQMEKAYGKKAGDIVYHTCDFAVAGEIYYLTKLPTAASLAERETTIIQNGKFNICTNPVTFSGINGLKNTFASEWNVGIKSIGGALWDAKGAIGKFIKIF